MSDQPAGNHGTRSKAGAILGLLVALATARSGAGEEPVKPAPPGLWAMVVGIEKYEEFRQFPPCFGAPEDAARVARWLMDTAGWEPGHILFLSDQDLPALGFRDPARRPLSRPATRPNLDWGAREWLARSVRPGDVVVVYFAGQALGRTDRPDDPRAAAPLDLLLPPEARVNDLEHTGWALGDAIEGLAARGENSIVCILDTSPAGRGKAPLLLGSGPEPAAAERMLRSISRWQGVTTWLAAGTQPAGLSDDGQGLLTRALIRALGTRRDARNVTECLDRLRRDPDLVKQGFVTAGGFDQRLSFWRPTTVAGRRTDPPTLQRGHGDRVTAIAVTADGSRMLSASMDSTLRVWHSATGRLLRTWSLVDNGCRSLAMSRDGRLAVSGGGNGDLEFIDLERDVAKTVTEAVHSGPVANVAILPNPDARTPASRLVLTVDQNGLSALWDASKSTVRLLVRPTDRGSRLPTVASEPGRVAFALAYFNERTGKETIRAFDSQGSLVAELPWPGGRITATCLAPDGKRLWVGTESGEVAEFDVEQGQRVSLRNLGPAIVHLVPAPLALIVASGTSVRLEPLDGSGKPLVLEAGRPIGTLALSADGRRIAVTDPYEGTIKAWETDLAKGAAHPLDLELRPEPGAARRARALSLAFSSDGGRLIAGDGSGSIRSWNLASGKAREPIAAGRGRVRHLAISPDERTLLEVTQDQVALVWDFDAERGTRQVPGRFLPAGGFLPSGDLVLIEANGQRNLVVHDRASLVRRPVVFDRPASQGGRVLSERVFSRLAVSKDGRVAASSSEGALACYWTPRDDKFLKFVLGPPIRDHLGGITAVSFSGDGRLLLTAADDGLAKLWDMTGAEPALKALFRLDSPGGMTSPITAAAMSPVPGGPVALGRQDGALEVWDPSGKQPPRVLSLGGHVRSVAFSPDGKFLAAGGASRTIMLRALGELGLPIQMSTPQSHTEMVNSLVFWPGGKVLASGSDDGTTRLWRLGTYRLLGTLSATGAGADWVVFTPEGLFDASAEGERLVTWVPDAGRGVGDPLPPRLEQYRKSHHVFDLADLLSRGEQAVAPAEVDGRSPLPKNLPPEIVIEPVSPPGPRQRRVDLKIRVNGQGLSDLRLYHNGAAVQGGLKLDGNSARTSILLVNGPNRIYALASRTDSPDGRSESLHFDYDGPTEGKTHVLALGVSEYQTQKLRFAHKDAQAMAEFLHANGIAQQGSVATPPILLQDRQVSRKSVADALKELRLRVQGRPEDTVVIFLAGHSEVRKGLFCMLLHNAILPTGPPVVAMRGAGGGGLATGDGPPPEQDPTLLPYGLVHRNLQFFDALNRLIIVDACQAEAVFDDPIVRGLARQLMRKAADRDAHAARTSYILATRRGERELAVEAAPLEHGLLTYVLLRGMGKRDLRELTPLPEIFRQHPTADLDRDGLVTTGELHQYAGMAVPELLDQFPDLVMRGPRGAPGPPPRSEYTQEADASSSFPLVRASRP
jgi:WD40 repeat protein